MSNQRSTSSDDLYYNTSEAGPEMLDRRAPKSGLLHLIQVFGQVRSIIEKNLGWVPDSAVKDFGYWRAHAFTTGMSISVMFGVPLGLAGSVAGVLAGMTSLAAVNAVVVGLLMALALIPNIPIRVRQLAVMSILMASCWAMVWVLGQATVWHAVIFLFVPSLTALLLGPGAAYVLVVLNLAPAVAFGVVLTTGVMSSPAPDQYDPISWTMAVLTILATSLAWIRVIDVVVYRGLAGALDGQVELAAELIKQNESLQQMNERLDYQRADLVAVIRASVHTFNEPLIVAGGYAQALGEDIPYEERVRYSGKVLQELEHLRSLMRNYGKYVTLGLEREDELVTPREVLDAVHEANPDVSIESSGGHSAGVVLGSTRDLVAMLTELLENARFHNHDDMPLQLSVKSSVADGRWTVTVTDDGVGIDDANIEQVFELFTRAGHLGKRSIGLGLAAARKVAHNHGGTISVTSTPGRQTEFVVAIPLAAVADSHDGEPTKERWIGLGGRASAQGKVTLPTDQRPQEMSNGK